VSLIESELAMREVILGAVFVCGAILARLDAPLHCSALESV